MDPIDNWEQMNVLQRVTMLTALIDETKDKGINTREAEGLMNLATNHIDSEEYEDGNQLLQKTYFSLKRLREQHLDDPTMVGGALEQPPPPPPSGKPKPTKGRCTICGGENLQFNDDGTGECPDCKRKFFWDRSMIPPPEPEVEMGDPEEAPVEGEIEMSEVEQVQIEEAPVGEVIREEAPLVPMPPEPEPSVPADPIDQGIQIQETFPPMARPPPPQEIDLMKVEDEKNLESVSIVVPKEEIPDEPEDEEEKPKDNFDVDDFFDLGDGEPTEGTEDKPEETPSAEDAPEETPSAEDVPGDDAPKDLEQIREEKGKLEKEREDVRARIKELEEQRGKGGE